MRHKRQVRGHSGPQASSGRSGRTGGGEDDEEEEALSEAEADSSGSGASPRRRPVRREAPMKRARCQVTWAAYARWQMNPVHGQETRDACIYHAQQVERTHVLWCGILREWRRGSL